MSLRPALSIKSKLLVACLLLSAVDLAAGVYSMTSQQRIGALGIEIYDRAFLAMSYLRSSQNGLAKLGDRLATVGPHGRADDGTDGDQSRPAMQPVVAAAVGQLQEITGDVQVASARAMSAEGANATLALAGQLASLDHALKANDIETSKILVAQVQAAFETAVEIYAGDGYTYRRDVQRLIDASYWNTGAAMATASVIALLISLALWSSIGPALRKAVSIARAISGGQLDRAFPTGGSDETAILMRALSDMRDSLVDKMGRIDALAIESRSRATALSLQNTRFEAALDNMHHGLCMVDAEHRLIVANQRFGQMFGEPQLGSDVSGAALFSLHAVAGHDPAVKELADGRVIHITSHQVEGGGRVVTFEDFTDRHRAESTLNHMSRHDALTGLPNRVLFRERMAAMIEEAGPPGPTLLFIDLDGFKGVNDTMGHGVGDQLLRAAAARLHAELGPTETIARLGGDEFALIFNAGDQGAAERRAAALVTTLQQPFDLPPHRIVIGASVGIAIRREDGSSDGADACARLLANADVALYRAKAEGKGTYRTHSAALDAAMVERRALEVELRTALERQELLLVFQPIVRAADGTAIGFEALLRWHHPTRGVIAPNTFIPIAEETGLITPIGQWVLRRACAEAAQWPAPTRVAVNLSPVQLRQGFLAGDVHRALSNANLPPERLELEITESVLLEDHEPVMNLLFQLRASGVRIALDDFGTGYSSLSYLRKFPFDKLKIDRSFVQNLSDSGNAAILQAMIGVGRALDVAVVAEGVETVEQAERLKQEGCTEMQGYLFGKPDLAQHVPAVVARLSGKATEIPRKTG